MADPARGQLVGYALAHLLDDDGLVEFFEDVDGQVPVHPTPLDAAAQRQDADPLIWPVLELRIVPEEATRA